MCTSLHIHVPFGKSAGLLIKLLSIQDFSSKFSCSTRELYESQLKL